MFHPKLDPKNTESSETELELVETNSDSTDADSTESSTVLADIAHATAEGLGTGIKGLHGIGKHIPHPLHHLERAAEVASEALHDNSTHDSMENKICGTLAGAAKVVVGATASVGLAVLTKVPVVGKVATQAIVEGVTAGMIGHSAQSAVNELTKPVGEAVNKVCHAAFDYCKKDGVVKAEINSEAPAIKSELDDSSYSFDRPFMHSPSPPSANPALTNPDYIKIVVDALPTESSKKTHIEFCKHNEIGEVCRYAFDLKDLEAQKTRNESFLATVNDTIDVQVYFPWEDKTVTLPPQMGVNFIRFLKHFKPWSEEYHCYHFATEMVYGENARVVVNRADLRNSKKDFTDGVGAGKVVVLYNDEFYMPLLQTRPTGHIAVSIGHDSYLGLSAQGINISTLEQLKTSMNLHKSIVVFDADKGIDLMSNKGQIDPVSIAFNAEKFYREIANTASTDLPIPDLASAVQGETLSALKSQTPTDSSRSYLDRQGKSRLAAISLKTKDTKLKQSQKSKVSSGASSMFKNQSKTPVNTAPADLGATSQSATVMVNESTLHHQVHSFLSANKKAFSQLSHHVFPPEIRASLTFKHQEYLSKWVAKAAYQRFQKLQQSAQAPLDAKSFTDNYVRILCGETQALNNSDYNPFNDLNEVIAAEIKDNPDHASLKEAYLKKAKERSSALSNPPQFEDKPGDATAQDRKAANAYVEEAHHYAQAASIAANLLGHKKAGAAFGEVAGGLACMTPLLTASVVSGGAIALAAAGGLLILHGALSVTGIISDDEEAGTNSLLQELGIIKSLIYDVLKNTIMIYNRMVEEFKHLNAKIDEYHLENLKRFMQLLQEQGKDKLEIMQYIQAHAAEILQELKTLKEYMPRIIDAYYELSTQQLSRHIAILNEFRSLHIQPDRRLVTKVESRLKTAEAVQDKISLAELRDLNTQLNLAATAETKQGNLTAAHVIGSPSSTRPEELQALLETLVLPTQQANIPNAGLATSAYAIELLRKTAVQDGWIKTTTQPEDAYADVAVGNPLLMQDRVKILNKLHKDYQKQERAESIEGADIRYEMRQTVQSLEDLQDFYHHIDPKKLITGLSKYLQETAADFKKAIQEEQAAFLTKQGNEAMTRMKQAIVADSQTLSLNVRHPLNFAYDETWGKFFHKFEISNFSGWTYTYGPGHPHIGWRYYTGALWGVFPSYPDPLCNSEHVKPDEDSQGNQVRLPISEAVRRGYSIRDAEYHWLSCQGDGVHGNERMEPLQDAWADLKMDCLDKNEIGLAYWELDVPGKAFDRAKLCDKIARERNTILFADGRFFFINYAERMSYPLILPGAGAVKKQNFEKLKALFTEGYKIAAPGEEREFVRAMAETRLPPIEAAFVKTALMPDKKSDLSEAQLLELITELRQNSNKTDYIAKQAEDYAAYQNTAETKLSDTANAVMTIVEYAKWPLFNDSLRGISGKPLPARLLKPMGISTLQQYFWLDVEELATIHPTVKQMELSGAGRIEATYNIQVIREQGSKRRVRATLNLQFVRNDVFKTVIPLDSASIEDDVATIYSLDEAAYHLWRGGKFASGETVNLSSREITNTRPVLIKTEHKPLLERMKPLLTKKTSLEKELSQTMNEWRVRYCQHLIENLKTNPALMAYLQRIEVIAGFIKSYFYLLQAHEIEGLENVLAPLSTKNVINYLEKYGTAPDAKGIEHYFETAMNAVSAFILEYQQTRMPEQFHDGLLQGVINQLSSHINGIDAFNQKMRQQADAKAVETTLTVTEAVRSESAAVDASAISDSDEEAYETDDEEIEVLEAVTRKYFTDNDIEEPAETESIWIKPDCDNYKPGERILPKASFSQAEDRVTFFNYLRNKKHYLVSKRRIEGETESIVQTQTVAK